MMARLEDAGRALMRARAFHVKVRGSVVARNSAVVMTAQLARLATQALYFVLVARALGPRGYGSVIGVAGLVGILAPFAGWGAGDVLVQEVSRDRARFRAEWAGALRVVLVAGIACAAVAVVTARFVLPGMIPVRLIVCLAIAECVFGSVISTGGQAFQACERLARTGQVWISLSLARTVAALVLFTLIGARTPSTWGELYLASTAVTAAAVVWRVGRELGTPDFGTRPALDNARRRFFYAVSLSATSVYNDIDKSMLARLATLEAAGLYGAAYRGVEMAFAPVSAVLYSSYSRFFREGTRGVRANVSLVRRLLPSAAAYAGVAGIALAFAAPLLGHVLGAQYRDTIAVVRGLAIVPLLRTLHYFAAHALTGADRQSFRTAGQVAVALVNVALNLVLLPRYGWRGAVWTTIASEALLGVLLWGAVAACARSERRRGRVTAETGMLASGAGTGLAEAV